MHTKILFQATVIYSDSSKEQRTYKVNKKYHLKNQTIMLIMLITILMLIMLIMLITILMMMFQENKLTGPAALFAASGERIEFEYQDGVVHGPAKIRVFKNNCHYWLPWKFYF